MQQSRLRQLLFKPLRATREISVPGDDENALAEMIANITVGAPKQLICLSVSGGFEHRLKRILRADPTISSIKAIDLSVIDVGDYAHDENDDDDDDNFDAAAAVPAGPSMK